MSGVTVLGVNAFHADASAVLFRDGRLVAAIEEERCNRIKHSAGLPTGAVRYCLAQAGMALRDLDHVAISRNPRAHLIRKIAFTLANRPSLSLVRERMSNATHVLDLRRALPEAFDERLGEMRCQWHRVEHHHAHIASAFFASPFPEAACLSIDGFGDFVSTMWAAGSTSGVKTLGLVAFPHSLGLLYTAATQYLGFLNYGDEYKVMGLAPYGEPSAVDEMGALIEMRPDGFRLNLDFFVHHSQGTPMTWAKGEPIIGRTYSDEWVRRFGPAREPKAPIEARHANIAASLQATTETVYAHLLNMLHDQTGETRLCVAGGVGFNSVANGKIRQRTPFKDIYIQPAAGDAGTALGAALWVQHETLGMPRQFQMAHAYWGPQFTDSEITQAIERARPELDQQHCTVRVMPDEDRLCAHVAGAIAEGKVVGWFQGRMEWGPRALGNRSILADPRRQDMKDILNLRTKRREPFRPFCPSVLEETAADYVDSTTRDPFMVSVHPIKPDKHEVIPAVTHVDGTGRFQTVSRESNPRFWKLIETFGDLTGVPVLLNTSFNENEPIVCTPQEALHCFLRTKIDLLALGNSIVERRNGGHTG